MRQLIDFRYAPPENSVDLPIRTPIATNPSAGATWPNFQKPFRNLARRQLANAAVTGAPEDQLRAPLEMLVTRLAELAGHHKNAVKLVGETTLAHLSSRPDYAVSVRGALAGFIELKAP